MPESGPVADRGGPLQRLDRTGIGGPLQGDQLEVDADRPAHLDASDSGPAAQLDLGQERHPGREPDGRATGSTTGSASPAIDRIEVSSTGNARPTNA